MSLGVQKFAQRAGEGASKVHLVQGRRARACLSVMQAGIRPATCIACCIGFAVAPLLRCVTQDRIERTMGTKKEKELTEFDHFTSLLSSCKVGQALSRMVLLCSLEEI